MITVSKEVSYRLHCNAVVENHQCHRTVKGGPATSESAAWGSATQPGEEALMYIEQASKIIEGDRVTFRDDLLGVTVKLVELHHPQDGNDRHDTGKVTIVTSDGEIRLLDWADGVTLLSPAWRPSQ